jgi:hypothetical protein
MNCSGCLAHPSCLRLQFCAWAMSGSKYANTHRVVNWILK